MRFPDHMGVLYRVLYRIRLCVTGIIFCCLAQMLELNPYAGSINERSVQNARARRVTTHNKRSETPCESQNEKQRSDEWAEGDKAEAVSHVGTGKVTHEVTEPDGMPQAA